MEHMGLVQRIWATLSGIASRTFPSIVQYQKLNTNPPTGSMTGRFRSYVWDPVLIISQMVAMQCIYYTTLGLISTLCLYFGDHSTSLHYIFDSGAVHYSGQANRLVMVAHVLNSLCGAIALWYVIQRAKQCLDFSCTLHFFHFIFCCAYSSHFPTQFTWWLIQLVCIVLMVVIGEYLCFRSDLKDIPLVGSKADV